MSEGDEEDEDEFSKYLPEYVPDGFELVKNTYNEKTNQYNIEYQNIQSDLFFEITILINSNDLYQDLSDYKKISYDSYDYYINNMYSLIWYYNNSTFTMTSNLGESELLKIASSIK
jgi:hypothetical protein